MLDFIVSE